MCENVGIFVFSSEHQAVESGIWETVGPAPTEVLEGTFRFSAENRRFKSSRGSWPTPWRE
jgi:hypothetical protein